MLWDSIGECWKSAYGTRCDGLPGRFVEAGCSCTACKEGRFYQHIVDRTPYKMQLVEVLNDL